MINRTAPGSKTLIVQVCLLLAHRPTQTVSGQWRAGMICAGFLLENDASKRDTKEIGVRRRDLIPYKQRMDLPESVRTVLPEHAQDIYRAAYNNA